MPRPVITLCSDFGLQDYFVGAMKGVILSICPEATLIDITHQSQPQSIRQAAFTISSAAPYFPRRTVHLVVVDPGVGSERRPIAVLTDRATYVAPDNGVLTMVLAQEAPNLVVHLTEPTYHLSPVSETFHGRDIFAPTAAHLAAGVDPHQMGEEISPSDLVALTLSRPVPGGHSSWLGEILHVDRFGNLVTNFRCTLLDAQCYPGDSDQGYPPSELAVIVGGEGIAAISRTYSSVRVGELVAYVGSCGYLEIAVREGRAADRLGIESGDPVRLELPPGTQLATQPGLEAPAARVSGTAPSAGSTRS